MTPLSICTIMKNEEKMLDTCLASIVSIADEIIIVDTGSTDASKKLAAKYTKNIYDFAWIDDFSAAYNFCREKATNPYCLLWDADFVLQSDSIAQLKKLKENDFYHTDLFFLRWNIEFGANHLPIKWVPRKLLYKSAAFHFVSPIHCQLVQNDPNKKLKTNYLRDVQVDHYKEPIQKAYRYTQTEQMMEKLQKEGKFDALFLFMYGEGQSFAKHHQKAIEIFLKYLQSYPDEPAGKKAIALEYILTSCLQTKQFDLLATTIALYFKELYQDPRFLLVYADTKAVSNLSEAKEYYDKYLTNSVDSLDTVFYYDYERYYIHPHFMLGYINLTSQHVAGAKAHLSLVAKNSRIEQTQEKAKQLLKNI